MSVLVRELVREYVSAAGTSASIVWQSWSIPMPRSTAP